jgi:penicillin-binding protein 1A
VVSIPSGHPLYNLMGQYSDVISDYLGGSAVSSSAVCTMHSEYTQVPDDYTQSSQVIEQARQILAMADSQLEDMDPGSGQYQAVRNAADYLRMLIGSGAVSDGEILSAIQSLTMALGGVY